MFAGGVFLVSCERTASRAGGGGGGVWHDNWHHHHRRHHARAHQSSVIANFNLLRSAIHLAARMHEVIPQ